MKAQLVLNFDINGTITNFDSTETANEEEMANMILARKTYGYVRKFNDDEGIATKWFPMETSINNQRESISYYNYLKSFDPKNYKQRSFVFTKDGQPGSKLAKKCQQMLECSHSSFIFPSFINVLKNYTDAKIVFRTFGHDGNLVIKELKEKHGYDKIFIEGRMIRTIDGLTLKITNGNEYNTIHDINDFINSPGYNLLIKEDYNYWSQNSYRKESGKIFIADDNCQQLFFDDNECVSVVDTQGNFRDNYQRLIIVNTVDAQIDPSYYMSHIKKFCYSDDLE